MFKHTETHEMYYCGRTADNTYVQVRRDTYWDSGFKSETELLAIAQFETSFEENAIPSLYMLEL